ncbi:MAG: serine/threonine protein kinase [Deltaproteobacteria bacterium]|nr:serine/threonine protein kinase [Deltaproteobacteria bacterium]
MVDTSTDDKPTVNQDQTLAPPHERELVTPTRPEPLRSGPRRVDVRAGRVRSLPFEHRYATERELGRGGMGIVSLCHDEQTGRHVAMKLVHPRHEGDETVVNQFVREARVQAQLEHPAVVPVYELSPTPDGGVFFTMKRVRGLTLRELIECIRDDDPTVAEHTLRRVLSDFSRVCQAVDYAHRTGMVHRDIKPPNVMVGEYGEVYLLDWGIAHPINVDASGVVPPLPGGRIPPRVVGTPGYIAPEQIVEPDAVDGRADVYALGCVLFELLTLTRLYAGEAEERLHAALEGVVVVPSQRAPARGIDPELDRICARALAREPASRYASAAQLHRALERYLDGQRDEALRRTMADRHAEHARQSAAHTRTLAPTDPAAVLARREALREVGQALALDPGHTGAMRTMVDLLTRPPDIVPPEVASQLRAATLDRFRAAGGIATILYSSMLLYLPLLWWAGVLDWLAVAAFLGLAAVAALVSLYTRMSQHPSEALVVTAMVISMAAMGGTATLYGPLVFTPGAVAINCTAFALTVGPLARRATMAVGSLAIVVPLLLELLGLVQPSYRSTSEGMELLSRALQLRGAPALVLLAVASVAMVLTGGFAVGRARDALDRAERQLALYSWHFRQLLPDVVERSS